MLFSIAPLAIVLVSIMGLVLQDEGLRADVVDAIVDVLPVSASARDEVEKAVTSIAQPASAVGLLSLLAFAWAASGMMAAIRIGLEAAMRVEASRPLARTKLVDFALVAGAGALVIAVVVETAVADLARQALQTGLSHVGVHGTWLTSSTVRVLPILVSFIVVMLIYRYVPAQALSFRDRLAGAIVTAILLFLLSLASTWIFDRTTDLNVIYGSLTTLFVFLYSVYLYACALLLGAEVAASWSAPRPETGESLGMTIKRTVVSMFVKPRSARPEDPPAPPDGRSRPA